MDASVYQSALLTPPGIPSEGGGFQVSQPPSQLLSPPGSQMSAASVYADAQEVLSEPGDDAGGGVDASSIYVDALGNTLVPPSPTDDGRRGAELKVVAQLQSLSVALNAEKNGERLALLAMRDLGANVTMPAGGGMVISGQLGNLTAQDTLTNPSSPYEMIGLRSETSEEFGDLTKSSLLVFEYNSPNDEERAKLRGEGTYDSSVKLRMSSVSVSYWHPAVMRTVSYLQSGVLGTLTSATANAVTRMARSMLDVEVSATSLDVEVASPLVLLPTTAGGSVGLRADLGRMGVKNTLIRKIESEGRNFGAPGMEREVVLDEIHVTLEQMKVDSVDKAFDTLNGVQMLRDVALDVRVERGVGSSVGRALMVTGRGGELTCDCSKVQYELLMQVVTSIL